MRGSCRLSSRSRGMSRESTWLSFFWPAARRGEPVSGRPARVSREARSFAAAAPHGRWYGRGIQYIAGQDALRVEQPVDQRLTGLVARPEHVVLEPFLRVREAPSEIDVHVGRVHQRRARRRATAPRPGKRQLDVAFGKPRVLPAVGMAGQIGEVRRARHGRAPRQNRPREASAP